MSFTESSYENAILQLFTQTLGYAYVYGPDIERDYHSPLYEDELLPALRAVNPTMPQEALDDAVYKLKNFESGTLLQKNMVFTDYLQNGVPVKFVVKGEERSDLVYLVDYQHPERNRFTAINQWTVVENSEKRADVVLFVNGLPLVVVELKSPSREETDASAAYRQLRNYMHEIPSLFIYNQVCVMSDLSTTKAGTITSGEDRYMAWKTKDGSYENTQAAQFDTFFEGIFQKERFLDILQNFICFNVDGANTFKILAGYHQYFAVKKAIESTKHATVTDGKGGVFWHTQGSGKSLSMVFYAHYLQKALESPTIVVITDRNDLDNQLYGQFSRCKDFLRQTPQQAESRQNLQELLAGRQAIDIYDMTQSVEDCATRPVYYESRVIHLKLNENILRLIDAEYDLMAQNADPYVIEKSKQELGQMEAILGNDETIASLVDDILDHYENYRANLLTGKAMIVAYSRPIAMKIYKRILQLRPAWTEKVGVVMTQGNNDPEEWREIIGNKAHKEDLARKFKDNDSPMKIAIVVDMWLTGFDVPSLATMYVYKPMSGHNLMQAIARVNRVFRDKEGGLVVDYVGIAAALKQAMNDYTVRDKKNYGDPDVSKAAYPKFLEKLEVCRDLFHGFDYATFLSGDDLEKARMISGGVNFLLGKSVAEHDLPEKERTQSVYIKEALLLKQALSLCGSLVDSKTRLEAAYFEAMRTMLVRLTTDGTGKKFTLPEVNERINELLKHSIQSEGVINLFSAVDTEFSLFDPKFLEEISRIKEKNLAVELLKKLIAEQVSIYRRTNVVKSEKFSEIIQSAMNRYLNGMLTNEEVIEELLKLAKDIAAANAEGEKLGLTAEELAFYDALTKPQAIKDFYEHDELIAITKELTDLLRKNRTIDWQKRESARAGMRRLVKRLLKKHRYPPANMQDAVQTVMSQCEMWTDNLT